MRKNINLVVILLLCSVFGFAQAARKPSAMRATQKELAQKATTGKNSLLRIVSQAEFDAFARVYHQGTPYALPHLMFLIDRRDKNKIYYINSKKYRFHKDFANATYLSLERGAAFTESNYLRDDRRFILGTLAWQTPIKKWTFEFWEGDLISSPQIKTAYETINKSFFEPVAFKPNSTKQDDASAKLNDITRISADDINKGQEYLALNTARGIGRVHIIEKLDDTVEIGYNEIIVLKEVPPTLPTVRGIIIAQPSTPLSHINLLAKGWNIPNAYIKNAHELLKLYDGKWIVFETTLDNFSIKPATNKELDLPPPVDDSLKTPPANLSATKLAPLNALRKKDSIAYGAKAANLGELMFKKMLGVTVPDGFSIPFVYYKNFMEANGFDKKILELLDDNNFIHNPRYRREKLKLLRAEIQSGTFDDKLKAEIISKWQNQLKSQGVFVRSSSNAEDLPNFSGAGLYDSVANVKESEKLIEAVKKVWASVWNYEAYEARERGFVDHTETFMSAFVQIGIDMDNGGVMITGDPFDKTNKGAVYIAATRGHNITVTGDGKIIPEQILFTPKSNSVQVLTRSAQDTVVSFDENGGLKEIPVDTQRRVLTDAIIRDLVKSAIEIKRIFGNRAEQDIEWGYMKGRIFIIQARPYIDKQ